MNMTSRRKTKKNSNETTEERRTPRKRGRAEGSTSSTAAVTPPETGRGQSRSATQTNPSQVPPESPPRKSRRNAATPDNPRRTSPRGVDGGLRPGATKESPKSVSPRGRGRGSRRGSTDSSASSVGNVSVASSSTPRKRGRRGSNSSGVSATSESSQVTPSKQTNRGRKRNKSNTPPAVLSKKTNGASPQYSPRTTKRTKASNPAGTSGPAANGRNGRRNRSKRGVSETPPKEDLDGDGGTDDEELSHSRTGENNTLENSADISNLETSELQNNTSPNASDVEEGEGGVSKGETIQHVDDKESGESINKDQLVNSMKVQQQNEKESESCENEVPQLSEKDSGLCEKDVPQQSDRQSKVCENSEKQNNSSEKELIEKHKDINVLADLEDVAEKSRLSTPDGAGARTCDKAVKSEGTSLTTSVESSTNSSSHMESAKRRQTSGESSDSGSPEIKPKPSKVARLTESTLVPDISKSVKTHDSDKDLSRVKCKGSNRLDKDNDRNLDKGKCDGSNEKDRSECVKCVNPEVQGDVGMDTVTRAERFLESLSLTEQQIKEVCSVLPDSVKDSPETRIVESLVETQLEGSNTVTTMNAPRFNKFLRQLLTHYCDLDTTKESKHALCEKAVQWARDRKSVNLRHELELTLMSLYYSTYHYKQAETVASSLYSETKKLQDKEKTVKACLCLSQVYHAMGNISKARANITTAKTEALKIYTPPDMQGELDLQSGIMQVAEGKDMETAYSYFKEAATGFTSRRQRSRALKYMLLSKIMVNKAEDGEKAVRSQSHIQDIDEGVEAMLAIASAANRSSLAEFRKTREQYEEHLVGDLVIASVLEDLYTTMMEKNLLNIVLPYERLQIDHIAGRISLPREEIERRISQMILDKRINAQLDHRDDCLYVYASEDSDVVYQKGIDILSQLDKTVSHLNRKVKKLL